MQIVVLSSWYCCIWEKNPYIVLILVVRKNMKEPKPKENWKETFLWGVFYISPFLFFLAPTVLGWLLHSAGELSDGITSSAEVPYQPASTCMAWITVAYIMEEEIFPSDLWICETKIYFSPSSESIGNSGHFSFIKKNCNMRIE